jgi:hypothetical protein
MYLGCIVLRRSIQKAAVQVFVSNVAIWPIPAAQAMNFTRGRPTAACDRGCVKSPVSCCRWGKDSRIPRFLKCSPILRLVSLLNAREIRKVFPPSLFDQTFYTASTLSGHSRRRRPASDTQQMRSFSCNYLTGTMGFKQDIYQAVVKIFGVDCTLSANV